MAELDPDVLTLVRGAIRSTWSLELLLQLRRVAPHSQTPSELVQLLRANDKLVKTCLHQLEQAGLVACEPASGCRYAPASPALDSLCADLAEAYRERPVAVINAILSEQNSQLKTFADAFRFKGKDE